MAENEPRPKHETRDVPLRPFIIFLTIMAAGAVLIHLGLGVVSFVFHEFNIAIQGPQPPIAIGLEEPPVPPMLLSGEPVRTLYQQQAQELTGYRWADRANGFVTMPIDEAMQIVATRGLPDWRNETDFRYW